MYLFHLKQESASLNNTVVLNREMIIPLDYICTTIFCKHIFPTQQRFYFLISWQLWKVSRVPLRVHFHSREARFDFLTSLKKKKDVSKASLGFFVAIRIPKLTTGASCVNTAYKNNSALNHVTRQQTAIFPDWLKNLEMLVAAACIKQRRDSLIKFFQVFKKKLY